MDAKARKVLNFLTKNDGEQEVFDISIAVKLAEDAVQKALSDLSDEDLVSRRSVGGKEFWSIAKAPAVASAPKKKRGPAVAGPDDHFDEFIIEAAAPAPVATSPAPIAPAAPSEPEPVFEDFEPKPVFEDFEPTKKAKEKPVIEDMGFEPKQKKEKKTKEMPIIDDDFEPKPKKEKKPKKEDFALPDDLSDDPLERPSSKSSLPIPLMAGAAALILIVILFVVGGGGKSKNFKIAIEEVKTEFAKEQQALREEMTAMTAEINKLRDENKALEKKVTDLKAEIKAEIKAGAKAEAKAEAKKTGSGGGAAKKTSGNTRRR